MKTTKFTIKGRIPSKKNSRIIIMGKKRPFSIPSTKYKEWHKQATLQIQEIKSITNIQEVAILIHFPDNRKADLTNKAESIMDLLVDNKIIADDCWQEIPTINLISMGVDKENPRAEVIITYEKNAA